MRAFLRLHAQAAADALRRFASQPLVSATSVLVLAVALALPVVAAIALRSAGTAGARLDAEPHINVFLAADAEEADARRIEQALKVQPEVLEVRFVSRTQALEELKATTHLAEILAALDRNPLPHAFTVRIRPTAADRVAALRAAWSALPKVDQVAADFEWSQRLARWTRFGERIVWGLGLALAGAVAFIVGHLIRLQVVTRREEVEVSQLIGATVADVRRPFVYHGFLQGLLAGLAAVGLAAGLAAWAGEELAALTPAYASDLKVLFLSAGEIAGVVLGSALLGLAGAWIAVHRQVRQFSA